MQKISINRNTTYIYKVIIIIKRKKIKYIKIQKLKIIIAWFIKKLGI